MKKFLLSVFFAVVVFSTAFAQVPASFNYQAVVRNSSGEILANKTVSFRISLLQGSKTGTVVYSEKHKVTTNDFGLVNLQIGKGTKISGNFSPAGWGDVIFTKVEIDPAGGGSFSELANSKLSSVPYAFKAQTVVNDKVDDADADPTNEIQKLKLTGTLLELSGGGGSVTLPTSGSGGGDNWGAQTVKTDASLTGNGTSGNPLSVVADGDGDDTNELQTLSKTGNSIQLSNGGGTVTDAVDDADADPANEIQSLSLSGNNLTIEGGNTVTLPESSSPWTETSLEVAYRGDKTVFIGDAAGGSSLKTKSAQYSNPPKFDISTGAQTGIRVYNETDGYYGINIWNEEGTAAYFGNNSSLPVAVFDNNDTGLAAEFRNAIKITDGNEGAGKVLTSDANGVASWQTPASGGSSLWTESGSNIYRSGGKVGIGTSSPSFAIDIQASAATLNLKATGANAIIYLDKKSSANHAYLLHRTNGVNKFYVGLLGDDDYWINSGSSATFKGLKVKADGSVATSGNLSVNSKLDADEIFCNSNLEVADEITVGSIAISGSEIQTTSTGTTNNLLPFAYGTITNTGGKTGCTSNVGTVNKVSTGQFVVSIAGLGSDYTIVVTPSVGLAYLTSTVTYRGTASFNASVWDTKNDTYYNGGFSFIVYKP